MNTYRRPFLIVSIAALLIAGLYVCDTPGRHQRAEQTILLEKELAQFVQTNTTSHTPLGIRVSAYSVLQRLSPLFALSGTDPEKLSNEVERFPLYSSQMKTLFPEVSPGILNGIYPRHIFNILPKLENARREVMREPSYKSVLRYDQLFQKTLNAYIKDLHEYEVALHESATVTQENGRIQFLGGVTSVDDITKAIITLKQAAEEKRMLQRARMDCIRGNTHRCESLSGAFYSLPSHVSPETPHTPKIPRPTALETKGYMYDLFWGTNVRENLTQEQLYILTGGPCRTSKDTSWYVTLRTKMLPNYIASLDTLWFYDISAFDLEKTEFTGALREMKEAGSNYIYQNISNLYFCPNNANTLTQALTAQTIQENLTKKVLFKTPSNDPVVQELADMERDIITRPEINAPLISYFLHKTALLLTKKGELDLANIIGVEAVLRTEYLLQIWKEQSGYMDTAVAEAMHTNIATWYLMDASNITPFGFIVSRAYPYLFFMPMNNSITNTSVRFGIDAGEAHGLTPLSSIKARYGDLRVQEELRKVREATRKLQENHPIPL